MNRIIKFRGKRIDNGEWVYGSLLIATKCNKGHYYICPETNVVSVNMDDETGKIIDAGLNFGCWYEVDPSTVGQFTGLPDKNGKEIYEGNVVARRAVTVWEEFVDKDGKKWSKSTNRKKEEIGLIKYSDKTAEFESGNCAVWLGRYDDIEVIGNIHDNPELLNSEAKEG